MPTAATTAEKNDSLEEFMTEERHRLPTNKPTKMVLLMGSTSDLLFERGLLDELDLGRLRRIAGDYYRPLMQCMLDLHTSENLDAVAADVITGGVPGLYTSMEGIILRGNRGQLWAAYIDGTVVRYFTTEAHHSQELPKTIEQWRSRFPEKQVVYSPRLDRTPKFLPDDN